MTSNMITPTVLFNGYRVPARYGPQTIPVHPGPLQIDVHARWLRRYGEAMLRVEVPPGQQVPVFYAAPYHQFTSGSIGTSSSSAWFRDGRDRPPQPTAL